MWESNNDQQDGFTIDRKEGDGTYTFLAKKSADETSHTDSGLTINKTYGYRVKVDGQDGDSEWSAEVFIPTFLNAPAALWLIREEVTKYSVNWTDNSSYEDGYTVERKLEGESFTVLSNTPPNVTSIIDSTILIDETYTYRVKATSSEGDSEYSYERTVAISFFFDPPENLTLTQDDETTISLAWGYRLNAEGYVIERKVDDGEYVILTTIPAGVTSFTDSDLVINETYTYRVKATSPYRDSGWSNEQSVSILFLGPSDLQLIRENATTLNLSWSDNSFVENGYMLERKIGEGEFTVISDEPANSTSLSDVGLSLGETYSYRVKAYGEYGESAYSNKAIYLLYETGVVTDIDGNRYNTIKNGDQWWMAENLKVSRYRDGSPIFYATDTLDSEVTPVVDAYYIYNNNASNEGDTYGYLYNWFAATDIKGLAPEGWHIPTDEEWEIFIDNLGGAEVAGDHMKQTGNDLWEEYSEATNLSGFTALPGGIYSDSWTTPWHGSGFWYQGHNAHYWSATASDNGDTEMARSYLLISVYSSVQYDWSTKMSGLSVRCVKDSP